MDRYYKFLYIFVNYICQIYFCTLLLKIRLGNFLTCEKCLFKNVVVFT